MSTIEVLLHIALSGRYWVDVTLFFETAGIFKMADFLFCCPFMSARAGQLAQFCQTAQYFWNGMQILLGIFEAA